MPIVLPSGTARVLVSGANGFIAIWVVKTLLDQGYAVRGTVRSAEKGKRLEEHFSAHGSKFEWVVVEDIAKDGAFDDAVKDVDAIEHIASPANLNGEDPDAYIKPAVEGTLGILRSALKFGHKVKRVVLTSSTTAIWRNVSETEPLVTFDENDWCDEALAEVREQGSKASVLAKYSASKALSEKAAWEFYREHQNEIKWGLVALLPAMVIGAPMTDVKDPSALPDSLGWWFRSVFQEQPDFILKMGFGYVDILDCASAHVVALQKENVEGERIIVCAGSTTFQDTRNSILSSKPELATSGAMHRGNPDLKTRILYKYDAEKGLRLLGLKYKDSIETNKMALDYFQSKGWLEGGKAIE